MSVSTEATPYLDALLRHRDSVVSCFNVPAHKAGRYASPRLRAAIGELALALDIEPMLPGIDMGTSPTPLEQSQGLAAEAWGAGRTWFIDGGGSGAVRASLLSIRQLGPRVLMQRNVHSSAIDGLVLTGLQPVFVHPEIDRGLGVAHCVSREALREALAADPTIDAVFLLSPTYYGTSADVAGLVEEAHSFGKPVVVDEAWGAHFAFSPLLPETALEAGADLVVSSTHKMAGSLTQSAMLHLGRSPHGFEETIVDRAVTALESTSANALLGASLDAARSWMATMGEAAIARTVEAAIEIRPAVRELGLDVLDRRTVGSYAVSGVDPLRVCIDCRPYGEIGQFLGDALRGQGVFPELIADRVLVAILAPGEELKHVETLVAALARALDGISPRPVAGTAAVASLPASGSSDLTPMEAWFARHARVKLRDSIGRVSADAVAVYPPGIPNVIPGEVITAELVAFLEESVAAGANVRGATDRTLATLSVVHE